MASSGVDITKLEGDELWSFIKFYRSKYEFGVDTLKLTDMDHYHSRLHDLVEEALRRHKNAEEAFNKQAALQAAKQ